MKMEKKIGDVEKIIWDVSGTLWSDVDQVIYANIKVLYDKGILTVPSCRSEIDVGKSLNYDWLSNNMLGSAVAQFRSFGLEGDDSYLEELYKKALKFTSQNYPVYLFEGISDLLMNLSKKEVIQGVISSHPLNHLHEDFSRLGVIKYFRYIKGSVHDKADSILEVAQESSLNLEKIIYVGDTMSDMQARNMAGVVPIGVDWGYQDRDLIEKGNPREIFSSVKDLSYYLL